jgi:capsular polysaccharide biosynthesis protein
VIGFLARAALVLLVGALAGAAALAFSNSQPKQYSSEMQLGFGRLMSPELQLLGPGVSEPQVDADVRIQTEAEDVKSFNVAQATAKAEPQLGYNAGQVAGHISVAGVRNTLVVAVTAKAPTPRGAARLAQAYGEQYIRLRRHRERRRALRVEDALKKQLNTLTKAQKKGVQGAGLRSQIHAVEALREVGSGSPQIIENARATALIATPNTLRNVLFGVIFGLAVGVGMVALRSESRSRAAAAAARRAPRRDETARIR